MFNIHDNGRISLTRGDSARLNVSIINDVTKTEYTISENDVLKLTLKKSIKDSVPALQKEIRGSSMFYIRPDDTSRLDFGKYKYDVEITTSTGDVYTVIGPSEFEILQEVTY